MYRPSIYDLDLTAHHYQQQVAIQQKFVTSYASYGYAEQADKHREWVRMCQADLDWATYVYEQMTGRVWQQKDDDVAGYSLAQRLTTYYRRNCPELLRPMGDEQYAQWYSINTVETAEVVL